MAASVMTAMEGGGGRRSLFSFLSPASSALSDNNCQSHVGIRFQNLEQSGNLEIVARIWNGVPVPRSRFFWKSKNLEQKINLEQRSPQSGNDLETIWNRSGNKKKWKKRTWNNLRSHPVRVLFFAPFWFPSLFMKGASHSTAPRGKKIAAVAVTAAWQRR
jgi:hypothetical protein